jgi:ABC-type multidrug transport system fused ATPase/permease subunit
MNKTIELIIALLPAFLVLIIALLFSVVMPSIIGEMFSSIAKQSEPVKIPGTGYIAIPFILIAVVFAIQGLTRYFAWTSGRTPSCPCCGSRMTMRTARRGRYRGQRFWGCSHYFLSGCRGKIHIG